MIQGVITDIIPWSFLQKPQNFYLAFTDELEKQIIIKKIVKVGQ